MVVFGSGVACCINLAMMAYSKIMIKHGPRDEQPSQQYLTGGYGFMAGLNMNPVTPAQNALGRVKFKVTWEQSLHQIFKKYYGQLQM